MSIVKAATSLQRAKPQGSGGQARAGRWRRRRHAALAGICAATPRLSIGGDGLDLRGGGSGSPWDRGSPRRGGSSWGMGWRQPSGTLATAHEAAAGHALTAARGAAQAVEAVHAVAAANGAAAAHGVAATHAKAAKHGVAGVAASNAVAAAQQAAASCVGWHRRQLLFVLTNKHTVDIPKHAAQSHSSWTGPPLRGRARRSQASQLTMETGMLGTHHGERAF